MRAWRRGPEEEIGATGPDVVPECRLVDNVGAGPHRGQGFVRPGAGGGVFRARVVIAGDAPALLTPALEPGALVVQAALAEFLHVRIVADGARRLSVRRGAVEGDQLPAAEEVAEVGGSED